MKTIKIYNNSSISNTWLGQTIDANTYYNIPEEELELWKKDEEVFRDISLGVLIVNDGLSDIVNPIDGWNYLVGSDFPRSYLGNKLYIHSSAKPEKTGKEFYLVWTGAGDNIYGSPSPTIGDGDLLQFQLQPGIKQISKIVEFAPQYGDVYIHEGYLKWENGGYGDYITANVVAKPTKLQTSVNLNLIVSDDGWVLPSLPGSPNSATHGFAEQPILIPRTKSKDGDWDYDPKNGLIPNYSRTGMYKISSIERNVHRYINKIPVFGNSYGYIQLSSNDTAYLPQGYFLKIVAYNISDTNWTCSIFMEIFREQTAVP